MKVPLPAAHDIMNGDSSPPNTRIRGWADETLKNPSSDGDGKPDCANRSDCTLDIFSGDVGEPAPSGAVFFEANDRFPPRSGH